MRLSSALFVGILIVASMLMGCAAGVSTSAPEGPAWPMFRGPNPNGPAPAAGDRLVAIDPEKDLRFKVDVPARGKSSPIIWGDRIYLSGEGNRIMAFDRASGRLLWNTALAAPAGDAPPGEGPEPSPDTGTAAPTPVTDGQYVCASFGTGLIGCVDRDGKQAWARRLVPGRPGNEYGLASSPALYGGLVIQVVDQGRDPEAKLSFVVALRIKDGKEAWKKNRPVSAAWSSPLLARLPEGDTLITTSAPLAIAYNPKTGAERWRAGGLSRDIAASPIVCRGRVIALPGEGAMPLVIKSGGKGDVTKTHVVEWTGDAGAPAVSSPATDGRRYFQISEGALTALSPASGKEIWSVELEGTFWASLVVTDGRIYAINREGTIYVVSTRGRKLAECKLAESVDASPAILKGRIYVRTARRLLCIGKP